MSLFVALAIGALMIRQEPQPLDLDAAIECAGLAEAFVETKDTRHDNSIRGTFLAYELDRIIAPLTRERGLSPAEFERSVEQSAARRRPYVGHPAHEDRWLGEYVVCLARAEATTVHTPRR